METILFLQIGDHGIQAVIRQAALSVVRVQFGNDFAGDAQTGLCFLLPALSLFPFSVTPASDKVFTNQDVENNKGSVLPSAGGMGAKVIYGEGAVLVLGAAVTLVSRKRADE